MNIANVLLTPNHMTPATHKVTGQLKAPVSQPTSDIATHLHQTPDTATDKIIANEKPVSDTAVTYDRPLAKEDKHAAHTADKETSEQSTEQSHKDDKNKTSNQEQFDELELTQIESLKSLDNEVRLHERAHAAVGGQYAGSPSYSYQTGPDGVKYAVSGEVSIDTAIIANDPQATLRKAQQIKAAALAPAEPSSQDRRVAAKAGRMASQARHDILLDSQSNGDNEKNKSSAVNNYGSGIPDHFSEQENLQKENSVQQILNKRITQINNLYQNSSTSKNNSTFQTQI